MSAGAPSGLPADLRDLVAEVVSQVPRLLALQDRDPDSPMRGCMHPAYWRDKSSEVADMRRQEAALAFAWLWRHPLPGNRFAGDRTLLLASLRALGFWTRRQHRDGTFDEWYVNEHGYATTAFSSYAVALAVEALGEELRAPLRDEVLASLARSARWLSTHDDWFKTNHQAVGVAALGAAGRVLRDDGLLAAARRNGAAIVARMHPEGWSKEISGLDVGYTFLLAEYLGMHAVLTGDTTFVPALRRAFGFAADFLHPDLTTGAEYGICGNPYFSRVATVVLARHDPVAAAVLRRLEAESDVPRDTSATLKDDLRLARYAYQPLLAALLHLGILARSDTAAGPATECAPPLLLDAETADRWHPGARLLAIRRRAYVAFAAACHGGLVRVAFSEGDGFLPAAVDRGYALDLGRDVHRTARYALDVPATHAPGAIEMSARFVRCGFVMPPAWARFLLRVATSLPMGHRWSRWLIDQWRRRKGTALNQSSAGVSRGAGSLALSRRVRFEDHAVVVDDTITSTTARPIPRDRLHAILDGTVRLEDGTRQDVDRRVPADRFVRDAGTPGTLVLRKVFRRSGDGGILVAND